MENVVVQTDKTYWWRRFFFKWGISAPGLTAQITFGWLPLIIAVIVSFQTFHFQQSKWCGLENYRAVFQDPLSAPFSLTSAGDHYKASVAEYKDKNVAKPNFFIKAGYRVRSLYYGLGVIWRNTFYYAILMLSLTFFVPIFVSILLMEMPPWLIRIMMLMWFIPIANMASTILIKYFYNVDYGLLNGLLERWYVFIGKPESQWVFPKYLNDPDIVMLCLVLPSLVMYMPGLVYITSLQGISQDLYDAAEIDGCGFFQKIWHITLPRLRPIISTMIIFAMLSAFQVMDQILIMTKGGPGTSSVTVSYYVYKLSFDFLEIGKGNALAVLFFIFLISLTAIQRTFFKEDIDKGESKRTKKRMEKMERM